MSQFSSELCKVESSNIVYTCRMSDCIVVLRLRIIALILQFFVHFFPILHVNMKNFIRVLSGTV